MATQNSDKLEPLEIITSEEAVRQAMELVEEGRNPNPNYLVTRWKGVNRALSGGFRFAEIYIIAGGSGVGKSYFLNQLVWSFLSKKLNGRFAKPFKILYFSFEMRAAAEMLRTTSTITGMKYANIISGGEENKLTDEGYEKVKAAMNILKHPDLMYVESTGNVYQMYKTVERVKTAYPDHEIVVACDHSLLPDYFKEKSEVELIGNVSKLALKLKKKLKCMVIFLAQLNDKIEEPHRIRDEHLHYPTKTDVHGGKSIYHAGDTVIALHSPEILGIELYGPKQFPTIGLIAAHFLKVRNGNPGLTRLKNMLDQGKIVSWPET